MSAWNACCLFPFDAPWLLSPLIWPVLFGLLSIPFPSIPESCLHFHQQTPVDFCLKHDSDFLYWGIVQRHRLVFGVSSWEIENHTEGLPTNDESGKGHKSTLSLQFKEVSFPASNRGASESVWILVPTCCVLLSNLRVSHGVGPNLAIALSFASFWCLTQRPSNWPKVDRSRLSSLSTPPEPQHRTKRFLLNF